MGYVWRHKDLMGAQALSKEDCLHLFKLIECYQQDLEAGKFPRQELPGDPIDLVLDSEPSTRTHHAFETAAYYLGAFFRKTDSITSSIQKGESLLDTCLTLQSLRSQALVLRTYTHLEDILKPLAKQSLNIPIINAGDGDCQHPTQALTDAFTLRSRFKKDLEGLKLGILGDVHFSRVACSNILLAKTLGMEVLLLDKEDSTFPTMLRLIKKDSSSHVHLFKEANKLLEVADAVMLLRTQIERRQEGTAPKDDIGDKGLDALRGTTMPILHPGPVEGDWQETLKGMPKERLLISKQAANGLPVRMAVLKLCLSYAASKK